MLRKYPTAMRRRGLWNTLVAGPSAVGSARQFHKGAPPTDENGNQPAPPTASCSTTSDTNHVNDIAGSSSSGQPSPGATGGPSEADASDLRTAGGEITTKPKRQLGDIDPELRAPRRATGLFSVKELEDASRGTVGFGLIDDVESDIKEHDRNQGRESNALLAVSVEEQWQYKLQFEHKVIKTPKHLTWSEFGKEVECLDCVIDLDTHRPEEIFSLAFQFRDRRRGVRDDVWVARHDVAKSAALPDFLAAIGACLGRSDVFRTIRFDDGLGTHREITIQKNSRYTSEVRLSLRPPVEYDLYATVERDNEHEDKVNNLEIGGWGFHPGLADPEYRDLDDPVGTYHMTLSAHALSIVVLKALDRLITRPLKDFYRPSQVCKTMRVSETEELGVFHALAGWLGTETSQYPHSTPMEAIEQHWFGQDCPFTLSTIIMKLREMTYLKQENPEFRSWLSVRQRDSTVAMRNIKLKLQGTGASTLFAPLSHNGTLARLLPKHQRRDVQANVSIAGVVGMPDETRRLAELKQIAETGKMLSEGTHPNRSTTVSAAAKEPASSLPQDAAPPSNSGGN